MTIPRALMVSGAGLVVWIVVLALRPPRSATETLLRIGQGDELYLRAPVYYTLVVVSVGAMLFGLATASLMWLRRRGSSARNIHLGRAGDRP